MATSGGVGSGRKGETGQLGVSVVKSRGGQELEQSGQGMTRVEAVKVENRRPLANGAQGDRVMYSLEENGGRKRERKKGFIGKAKAVSLNFGMCACVPLIPLLVPQV